MDAASQRNISERTMTCRAQRRRFFNVARHAASLALCLALFATAFPISANALTNQKESDAEREQHEAFLQPSEALPSSPAMHADGQTPEFFGAYALQTCVTEKTTGSAVDAPEFLQPENSGEEPDAARHTSLQSIPEQASPSQAPASTVPEAESVPGDLIQSAETSETPTGAPAPYTSNVVETLQNPELPAGCEAASLAAVLNSMEYETSPTDIVEHYLAVDPTSSSAHAFAGNPYVEYGGAAFPPAIVDAANAFLSAHQAPERALDLAECTFADIRALVAEGYPVITWSTMGMVQPTFTGEYLDEYAWYAQEHCVVVYGFQGENVLVCDPLEGLIKRNAAAFEQVWHACGAMAVVIS